MIGFDRRALIIPPIVTLTCTEIELNRGDSRQFNEKKMMELNGVHGTAKNCFLILLVMGKAVADHVTTAGEANGLYAIKYLFHMLGAFFLLLTCWS